MEPKNGLPDQWAESKLDLKKLKLWVVQGLVTKLQIKPILMYIQN